MLFGRSVQLQFVKPSRPGESLRTINLEELDYEKLGVIAKDTVKVAAVAIVGIGAAFFAMSTARQIIVNLANPANYK